jgi:beta-lactamase regulating signal transducer with metallopeptidase domain
MQRRKVKNNNNYTTTTPTMAAKASCLPENRFSSTLIVLATLWVVGGIICFFL